jgi:nucleoside-diphosphate-sugar epimerase
MDLRYEHIVTGRQESLFAGDLHASDSALRNAFAGSRVAIVGAAGSIGSAVVKVLLRFAPGALTLIDLSENNLVELVRDLRSTDGLRLPAEFATLPIGMGSVEFARYFAETKPFDYFLNLSAIKHVRTERDVYCLVRMIDTNVLFLHEFLSRNPYRFKKVFSVSSDKATNPANLMGATKMIMEKALLARSDAQPFSTARFANVAFSDGSLPFGFLQRLAKRQPLSAPHDVRRYFLSHQEAGELCVLSCGLGENRDVFFPNLAQGLDEKTFADIARELLVELGYKPVECASEEEAKWGRGDGRWGVEDGRGKMEDGNRKFAPISNLQSANSPPQTISNLPSTISTPRRPWPCYFFKSDTTGEKEFEEFFAQGERLVLDRFERVGVVKGGGGRGAEDGGRRTEDGGLEVAINDFLGFVRKAKTDPTITKVDYVREIQKLVPTLQHHETGRNLDQKM